jgi:hypothetical protein
MMLEAGLPKSPLEFLRAAADSGDVISKAIYGYRFYVGDGVPQDFEKAANYFKLAADQGHAVGQFNYGICFENGHGVAQDLVKAAEYYYHPQVDKYDRTNEYKYDSKAIPMDTQSKLRNGSLTKKQR